MGVVDRVAGMSVQKETIRKGDGVNFPKKGQKLKTHYKGTLASNGFQFDSSYDDHRGGNNLKTPFSFVVGKREVLQGFEEGVLQMSLGEKAKLMISSDLCYGQDGCVDEIHGCASEPSGSDGFLIPPNADLIFEVELLGIESFNYKGKSSHSATSNNKTLAATTNTSQPQQQPATEAEEAEATASTSFTSKLSSFFYKPVERPKPVLPDSTLDEDLQNCADDANLTLYFVNMVVVGCKNLPNVDGILDKSDPYCEVQIGELTDRTDTIRDDLNPVWNEKMSFFVPQKPASMTIRIKDSNKHLQDVHMCATEFQFGSFFEIGGFFEGEIPLQKSLDDPTAIAEGYGTVQLHVKCRTLKPVETEIKLGYVTKQLDCLGIENDANKAALDESEELRKQVIGELSTKEQEVIRKAEELEQAVTQHNRVLSVKDQELLDRAQQIEDKIQEAEEAEVAKRQALLEKKQAETKLTDAEQEILKQAELLEEKERTNQEALTAREKEILEVAEQLEAKEKAHRAVTERLEQVEALKVEVENELTSKDKIIQDQARELEKAQRAGQALTQKEQELLQTAQRLEDRDAAAKQAQRQQDAANAELDKLRQKNEELEAKVVEASKCGCIVM